MTCRCILSRGVVALAIAGAACNGGGGQNESTATEPQTTEAMTADTPTEGMPTESSATAATTEATSEATSEATEGTTGGPGDPALYEQCLESFTAGKKIVEAQCTCLVEQDNFPDIATCLDAFAGGAATDECTCEVYSKYPETKAGFDCAKPAQTTVLGCLDGVSCAMGSDEFLACMQPYFAAVENCGEPPVEATSEVTIVCGMEPPFMCASGETIPESWKCDFIVHCEDASDESACPDSFACVDGTGYVPNDAKCDGVPQCVDQSDEAGCPTFMCRDGNTIPESWKCDGAPDCRDMSDESGCPTFMCMNGQAIPLQFKCNGFSDCCTNSPDPNCMDNSDEDGCPLFMCADGSESIPGAWKCDGEPDCVDASDETDCP